MKRVRKYTLAILLSVLICIVASWLAFPKERPSLLPGAPSLVESKDVIMDGEEVAPPPLAVSPSSLEIVAAAPPNPIRRGERVGVGFWLKNSGPKPVWVVRSLDGSALGRSPKCVLEIRDESGRLEVPEVAKDCGNLNPLREEDFIFLGPKEVLPAALHTTVGCWKPSHPGIYSLRMTYDTTAPLIQRWAGDTRILSPRVRELLSLVQKGRVVSDILKVSIVD